jgi:hypothetical protein
MKVWEDYKGWEWFRGPERGSVVGSTADIYCIINNNIMRKSQFKNGWRRADLCTYEKEQIRTAIARLWPPLTKAQLWRRLCTQLGLLHHYPGDEITVAHIESDCAHHRRDTKVIKQRKAKIRALLKKWEEAK